MNTLARLHIPRASASWKLVMQSGVGLAVTVGIPLSEFFAAELGLTDDEQRHAETIIMDGMPVDDPATAVIENNSRLALAAGLPGIAGLSMKRNSAVRGLRNGITHRGLEQQNPRPGRVILCLYSLILPALGGHFLQKGVIISPAQFRLYARFALGDLCFWGDRQLPVSGVLKELAGAAESDELLFSAVEIAGQSA